MSQRTVQNLFLNKGDLIVHKGRRFEVVVCDVFPSPVAPTVQVVAQTYPTPSSSHVRFELDAADYSVVAVDDEPPKPKRWPGQPKSAAAVGSRP